LNRNAVRFAIAAVLVAGLVYVQRGGEDHGDAPPGAPPTETPKDTKASNTPTGKPKRSADEREKIAAHRARQDAVMKELHRVGTEKRRQPSVTSRQKNSAGS
jgi:hypothetical protein